MDAYPLYTASVLGANSFTRSVFAAAFPLVGTASRLIMYIVMSVFYILMATTCIVYNNVGNQWATSVLAFLSLIMVPFPSALCPLLSPQHPLAKIGKVTSSSSMEQLLGRGVGLHL